MTIYRVPMEGEQFQAVLEAALDSVNKDSFLTENLLKLAISFKRSLDDELEWRMEDES